jgi:glycosyltransferase involved in cell wall biosynthesis
MGKVKKVLIVAYHFPPRPGVASLRPKGLAKFLPEFGWETVVLTATLPGKTDERFKVVETPYRGDVGDVWKSRLRLNPDKGFQEQIGVPLAWRGSRRSVTRTLVRCLKSLLAYPDEQKYWYSPAVKEGAKLLQNSSFDALISSSGPVTAHLIGRYLKLNSGLPWVADLRDLWSQYHYYHLGWVRRRFDRRLELTTLDLADALVTVSEPLAEKLQALHPHQSVHVITNGFDPDEAGSSLLTKEFSITYTGQIYAEKQRPEILFKALAELIAEGKVKLDDVQVRFYGRKLYWLDKMIKDFKLEEVVKQFGFVSRDEVLLRQRESQVLALFNWSDFNESGIYTGKLFEYLAAGRPILAIGGCGGVTAKLLEETKAGSFVGDVSALKGVLMDCYREYKTSGSVSYKGREDKIVNFSYREIARRYASLLDEVSSRVFKKFSRSKQFD